MATDDAVPGQRPDADSWLRTLCASRHFEIVGPSRHGPDAVDVTWMMMGHDLELWVVSPHPLGAAALDCFQKLFAIMYRRFHHANILWTSDGRVHEGRPYLLVPRHAEDTLAERIGDRPLPVAEAVDVAIDLCRAVHFAHDAGFVQLDLSPNQVRLADGIPTMIDVRRTLTRRVLEVEGCWIPGAITGCEAPEILQGETPGPEADIYSLGAILYQMLTGRRNLTPHASGLPAIRQVLEQDPERPCAINKCVDQTLESICLRCLARQKTSRYDSAASLGEALERWRSNTPQPRSTQL